MTRHKRHTELWPGEVEKFLSDATAFHGQLMEYARSLKPQAPHGQAIAGLHRYLVETIRVVTGEDPPWMRLRTSDEYPGNQTREADPCAVDSRDTTPGARSTRSTG